MLMITFFMMLMTMLMSGTLSGVTLVSISAELRTSWAPETATQPGSLCTVSHLDFLMIFAVSL